MNIKELFKKVNKDELIDYLIKYHYKELYKNEKIELNKKVLKNNINKTIQSIIDKKSIKNETYNNFYVFVVKSYDYLSIGYEVDEMFDVFACYKNEIKEYYDQKDIANKNIKIPVHWGIELMERCYLVDLEIANNCIEEYGEIVVAGEIFWEITFFGDKESSVEKVRDELNNRCEELEYELNNQNEDIKDKNTKFEKLDIDEFFKSIDPEYIPLTKEELEIEHEKELKIIEKNKIIYKKIFTDFLKL